MVAVKFSTFATIAILIPTLATAQDSVTVGLSVTPKTLTVAEKNRCCWWTAVDKARSARLQTFRYDREVWTVVNLDGIDHLVPRGIATFDCSHRHGRRVDGPVRVRQAHNDDEKNPIHFSLRCRETRRSGAKK